jgi:uncharacterized membrane protein
MAGAVWPEVLKTNETNVPGFYVGAKGKAMSFVVIITLKIRVCPLRW